VTGNPERARIFRAAWADERTIWRDLAPLARDIGPSVHERFVEARTVSQLWHQQLNADELLRPGRDGLAQQYNDAASAFEEVLTATARLDSAIIVATGQSRTRIADAERAGLLLTFLSGGLAFVAAVVVGLLVLRIRRLAEEAERRRRETADALAESARAADARRRLLRGITHDVKNPLGAARGYAELLAMGVKGPLNPDQEKLVQGAERSIDGALAIISDLLDLARVDSGGITVQRMSVDLIEVASQAVEDHRAAAEAAGHHISLQDAASPLECYTDPVRVRQVLDNLLSNAIKYTPAPGHITVSTDPDARDAPFHQRAVAIRVADNGPGIPADKREFIFDEFTRMNDVGTLKGHGLGLAIARRMARLLGGELDLLDGAGSGATFALWLPQREQRTEPRVS
jgi:signal transduction histidine kinase